MSSDRLSPSELLNYHRHRRKMRHTFICTECKHAFDRERPVTKCIFCGAAVKEMERDDLPKAKPLFRYTCSACDKIFITEHADVCPDCGSRFLHFYEMRNLSTREILSMRKKQFKERIKMVGKRTKGIKKKK